MRETNAQENLKKIKLKYCEVKKKMKESFYKKNS